MQVRLVVIKDKVAERTSTVSLQVRYDARTTDYNNNTY